MALKFIKEDKISISGDVPLAATDIYVKNYIEMTKGSGKVVMFVCDQKLEHLNDAFVGPGISEQDADPEHMFRIASQSVIGCMAAQPGLIAKYGYTYPDIPYLVKINSTTKASDFGTAGVLGTIEQAYLMRRSGLNIVGIGYTMYIGSKNEHLLLQEAAQIVHQAHRKGLVTLMWAIDHEEDDAEQEPQQLAGNAGVALALGFDFVHLYEYVKEKNGIKAADRFNIVVKAAGLTQVSVRAGRINNVDEYLSILHEQINKTDISGTGVGRAIHQKSLKEAVNTLNAISAIVIAGDDLKTAKKVYETGKLSKGLKDVQKHYNDWKKQY